MVLRCCLTECARRKCDPSRAGGGILPGRPVAGRGDRAGLPGCPWCFRLARRICWRLIRAAALIPAVDLPPIAGPADVEHHPAPRPSAEQLPPHHFSGHRAPHDSMAAREPCRVGGDAGDIDLELGGVKKWAEQIGRKYERGECSRSARTDPVRPGARAKPSYGLPLLCP